MIFIFLFGFESTQLARQLQQERTQMKVQMISVPTDTVVYVPTPGRTPGPPLAAAAHFGQWRQSGKMRAGLRTMERVLHGETQAGHAGRAWHIRLAEKTGGTKRRDFQPVAQTKTHRSETTTVGSLLRCVHTIQIKLRGRQGRRDLLWCASIRIGLAWLRPESRERRVQFALCLSHTNTHSNIQIALGVRVASKCYARAPPLRNVYTVGKKQYLCSTIGMLWGNNKLECPLHYWLVCCERHERRLGLERLHEYVT